MNEIIRFFKEIFMLSEQNDVKVGLSQFKSDSQAVKEPVKKAPKQEIKLSDLMRRSA